MKNNFEELALEMRNEVLYFLSKRNIDLTDRAKVCAALDDFNSDIIVEYMDEHNVELLFTIELKENYNIHVSIWEA